MKSCKPHRALAYIYLSISSGDGGRPRNQLLVHGPAAQTILLAPDIIEAIVDGLGPDGISIEKLRKPLPLHWAEQRDVVGLCIVPENEETCRWPVRGFLQ